MSDYINRIVDNLEYLLNRKIDSSLSIEIKIAADQELSYFIKTHGQDLIDFVRYCKKYSDRYPDKMTGKRKPDENVIAPPMGYVTEGENTHKSKPKNWLGHR